MTTELDIGEVQERTGLPVSTLHVWERHGLITASSRKGLRRQYEPGVLERIAVIVMCQRSGFSLDEIGKLLKPDAFRDGKVLLESKIRDLEEQRRSLDQAIDGLRHAMSCSVPNPITCPDFRAKLGDVLPVQR